MKSLITLTALCLCACHPETPADSVSDIKSIPLGEGTAVFYRVVVLDGNEYYATHVQGGYSLCPKLPLKPKP